MTRRPTHASRSITPRGALAKAWALAFTIGAPATGISYRLVVPRSMNGPVPLLVVYSGTEGGGTMASNLVSLETAVPALARYLRAVLDGVTYRGDGEAGAMVLDDVRSIYDVDNDRTYLLGESAGTTGAFALGFHLRPSWFAAYWANHIAAARADGPVRTATELGFAPWGQVGPAELQHSPSRLRIACTRCCRVRSVAFVQALWASAWLELRSLGRTKMEAITVKRIEEIEAYTGPHTIPGIRFRPAREALEVTSWGMSVLEFEPGSRDIRSTITRATARRKSTTWCCEDRSFS